MKRVAAVGAWLVGLILAQVVAAQELRPQVVPEDRATPRGTLKVLKTAMEKGDDAQIRAILIASNDTEKQMIDAMAETAASVRRLHDAAIQAYGADAAKPLTGEVAGPGPDGLTELDRATEAVAEDGTTATVSFQDIDAQQVKLVRQGEQWSVPVGELARQMSPQEMAARMQEVRTLNATIDEVAAEVSQKRHRTAEEARQSLHGKLIQAASAATTRPATQPTTRPAQ